MDSFVYRDGELYCEETPISAITESVGTPAYVYSRRTLETHYKRFERAFAELSPQILYSVKSCGNLSLLRLLVDCGAGMDVVSGGELFRALKAGAKPADIVFAGVGKSPAELEQALDAGIGWLNVESEEELVTVEKLARTRGVRPNIAVRLNPDVVDSRTHPNTATGGRGSKFGIDLEQVRAMFERFGASSSVDLTGLHFHLGSPIYSPEPYVRAIEKVLGLVQELRRANHRVSTLDIGGGFMAEYDQNAGKATSWEEYAQPITRALAPFVREGGRVLMEPGRTISANAGLLVSKVLYGKSSGGRELIIVDTGMHHMIRPALYDALQFMWPVKVDAAHVPQLREIQTSMADLVEYDVVGPICESTDRLARGRRLPRMVRGDLLAIFSAGAYGMVMASQYNAVPRPPEVLVEGSSFRVIRRRESYDDLVEAELAALTG